MNIKYIYTYIYRHLDTYIKVYTYIVKVFKYKKHFLLLMFRHVLFIKISLYTYISIYI